MNIALSGDFCPPGMVKLSLKSRRSVLNPERRRTASQFRKRARRTERADKAARQRRLSRETLRRSLAESRRMPETCRESEGRSPSDHTNANSGCAAFPGEVALALTLPRQVRAAAFEVTAVRSATPNLATTRRYGAFCIA
jgi:hypothetical protein